MTLYRNVTIFGQPQQKLLAAFIELRDTESSFGHRLTSVEHSLLGYFKAYINKHEIYYSSTDIVVLNAIREKYIAYHKHN